MAEDINRTMVFSDGDDTRLVKALDFFKDINNSNFILVGDEKQLPPIGYGKPSIDIINFITTNNQYQEHYIRLKTNCRQEYDETILELAEIFGDKSALILEEYRRTFNGEEHSFELFFNNQHQLYRTVPLVSEDSSVNRILSVVENITDRKVAERKLQESEELFRTLTEAMPHIVWSADKNGKIDFFNEQAYEFTGISKSKIGELSWDSLIHPEDYKETIGSWNNSVRKGKIFRAEQRLKREDGEYRWHLAISKPVLDISGNIIGWIGTATDIHEQKSMDDVLEKILNEQTREIREVNAYNRHLFEISLDSLVIIDMDEKIIDANNSAELIIGLSRDKLIGTYFSVYFTEPENAKNVYLRALSEETIKDYPLTIRHISGRTTDVLYNASVIRNNKGKITGVFTAAHDISDIKKAQQNIKLQADRHHTILSTVPDGYWVVNKNGRILDVNDNYLKMSGYTREEVIGRNAVEIGLLTGTESVDTLFQTRDETGKIQGREISLQNKWGKVHTVLSSVEDITIGDETCLLAALIELGENNSISIYNLPPIISLLMFIVSICSLVLTYIIVEYRFEILFYIKNINLIS